MKGKEVHKRQEAKRKRDLNVIKIIAKGKNEDWVEQEVGLKTKEPMKNKGTNRKQNETHA